MRRTRRKTGRHTTGSVWAVTTRLPSVGTRCPFVSEHAAVATQSLVNTDLGEHGLEYIADGFAIDDALEADLLAEADG